MTEAIQSNIIFHLVGEQTNPIYLSAIQFEKSYIHHLIVTETTLKSGENLMAELKRNGYQAVLHNIGPNSMASDFKALFTNFKNLFIRHIETGASITVNITGGTKPMSIVSMLCGTTVPELKVLRYFYLDFSKHELVWLHDFSRQPLEQRMTIENFIHLAGTKIKSSAPQIETPADLNAKSYGIAFTLQRTQEIISKCLSHNDKTTFETSYETLLKNIKDDVKRQEWKDLFEKTFEKESWVSKAKYLSGGWFEDYVYDIVRQNAPQVEISKNLSIIWSYGKDDAQEFDICYTDGFSFYILECKAGSFKQDYIQKLENIRNKYSGALGLCALITVNSSLTGSNARAFTERVENSRSIAAFCSRSGLNELKTHLFNFKTGQIYENIPKMKKH